MSFWLRKKTWNIVFDSQPSTLYAESHLHEHPALTDVTMSVGGRSSEDDMSSRGGVYGRSYDIAQIARKLKVLDQEP